MANMVKCRVFRHISDDADGLLIIDRDCKLIEVGMQTGEWSFLGEFSFEHDFLIALGTQVFNSNEYWIIEPFVKS